MRLMLVGSVGCGKTTLLQRLDRQDLVYAKTQTTCLGERFIDTPGEYLTYGWMRRALQQASYDSDMLAFLQSATEERETIPPVFHTYFTLPVIGVVTKIDLAGPRERAAARERLERAGAGRVWEVSALTGEGVPELAAWLGSYRVPESSRAADGATRAG